MEDALRTWLESFVREPSFLAKYPYYAAVLAKMAPVLDPSVESMVVSFETAGPAGEGRFYLHVNADRFVREPQYVRGILLHEVHHVVLGHLTNPKFFSVEHPNLMELAEEVSANEHVEEELPNPITWRTFEGVGLKPGQSTLERYEKLVAAHVAKGVARSGDAKARDAKPVDAHRWNPGGKSAAPPGGVEWTRRLIEAAADLGAAHDDERPKLLAGKTPGRLIEDLVGITGAPESFVDWKTALRRFVARARNPLHTWARPSRRFPDRIGQVPGRVWMPRPVLRPVLLVVIDTSMSMRDKELTEIARQLVPMSEEARLVIVECDTEITNVHGFDGKLPRVKGRGGTDLRPPLERAFLASQGADGVVYFTDGQGPHPDRAPEVPVLWMLTKPQKFECPFGERARLDVK